MKKPQPFWKHWNLNKNPFGCIESVDDVFESSEMGRIMEHLAEAVEEGGIYSVTGERGIGKTSAKNEIINYFNENNSRYVYCCLDFMDMKKITISTVQTALVMELSSEAPKQNAVHRRRQVRRIMGELASFKKIILVIDEAHKLTIPALEDMKMLTEMTWGFRSKLITVLLFGQAELTARLARDQGLFLRVTQYHMKGLTTDEVLQYIDLRCRTAGGNMTEIFDQEALTYIAENQHSPLHINHVCSSTMRAARRAGEKKVTVGMVYESGGIRSPRQILRDNGISVKKFASQIHMHDQKVTKMLGGETDDVSAEHQARFKDGISNLARGTKLDTEYSEGEKKVG